MFFYEVLDMDGVKVWTTNYSELCRFRSYWSDQPVGEWISWFTGQGNHSCQVEYSPYRLPGWRQLIKNRQSATTNMECIRFKLDIGGRLYARATARSLIPGPDYGRVSIFELDNFLNALLGSPINVAGTHDAENQARERFLRKAKQAQRQAMSLVMFGDIGKTLRMIRHPLRTLYNSMNTFLRRPLNGHRGGSTPRERLRAVSDVYLEKRFGWDNLMYDIDDHCKALAEHTTYRLPGKAIGGRGVSTVSYTQGSTTTVNGPYNIQWRRVDTTSKSVRYNGFITVDNGGGMSQIGQSFGLLPRDWLPTLWELLPYSFVVDYFTNIGSIIEALTFNWADFAWVERSSKDSDSCQILFEDFFVTPSNQYEILSEMSWPGKQPMLSYDILSRTPHTGSLIPRLDFKIPGLGLKWLNMAALVAQGRRSSNVLSRH
jgi:hypothetical protein